MSAGQTHPWIRSDPILSDRSDPIRRDQIHGSIERSLAAHAVDPILKSVDLLAFRPLDARFGHSDQIKVCFWVKSAAKTRALSAQLLLSEILESQLATQLINILCPVCQVAIFIAAALFANQPRNHKTLGTWKVGAIQA